MADITSDIDKMNDLEIGANKPVTTALLNKIGANIRTDLFFLWSDRVSLFLQDESGNFPRSADQEIIFSSFASSETCFPIIADCNGDKRPDVVALRLQGGISAAECKVDFYLSDQAGRFAKSPNKTLTLSQARASLLLTDIDGDGRGQDEHEQHSKDDGEKLEVDNAAGAK